MKNLFKPPPLDLPEDKYKNLIFNYFVGTVWVLAVLDTAWNVYLALTLEGQLASKYSGFIPFDVAFLALWGLTWLGHRWYPRLMRHLFLVLIIIGTIFFFNWEDIDRIFIAYAIPIIMAAFLIRPIYSFVYLIFVICAYTFRFYQEGFSITGGVEYNYVSLLGLAIISVVAWLIALFLERSLAETRALNRDLDQRVQERTRELAAALRREHTLAVRNKTILEAIADGVLVFDADQQVVVANPAANRLARRDLRSFNLSDFLATVEGKARDSIRAWLAGQKPSKSSNVRFEWYNRIISANVAPVILPGTEDKRVGDGNVMVLRDFTKEAELERAKDVFLGMVSHELRTPMTAIQGYVDLLLTIEKEQISAKGYQYLQTINDSVKQLLKLANELIDLSRLETGEIELYYQWVDLAEVVGQAVKIVQQEFASRKLNLEVKLEDNLPQLYVDRNRINQVLLNLLSNAYKYTTTGGAIVAVSQNEEWININISDTGIGIKEIDQEKLFERFFRAADRIVQQASGTGLGLNISKGLIELHGGTLTFESKYGAGTTFNVALPKPNDALSDEFGSPNGHN
ncbi:MAG: hypothetical protein JW953_00870 [Anaerolineae bacterium]|nr:hypothetical protein [Anaerolineae bacterium]